MKNSFKQKIDFFKSRVKFNLYLKKWSQDYSGKINILICGFVSNSAIQIASDTTTKALIDNLTTTFKTAIETALTSSGATLGSFEIKFVEATSRRRRRAAGAAIAQISAIYTKTETVSTEAVLTATRTLLTETVKDSVKIEILGILRKKIKFHNVQIL